MQIRTGVSGVPSFKTFLPSNVFIKYQHPQLRLGLKLQSDSSFSSGLFSCEQVRVNATIPPSLQCTACLGGVLWSVSGFSTTLSAASFICYQKDRETNCVSVSTYSLGFILEREINDSISSWSIYIKTWGVKSDILYVCVCVHAWFSIAIHLHSPNQQLSGVPQEGNALLS